MEKILKIIGAIIIATIFTIAQFDGYGQTTPLTYANIPFGNADLQRPGAGANQWSYNQNVVNIPVQGVNTPRLDAYWRFTWLDFQPAGGSQNVFSFAALDAQFQASINNGQGLSIGVMQQCTSCDANLQNPISGNTNLLPTWLINAMPNSYAFGGDWYPDYNSSSYLNALKNLSQQINNHIMTTTYKGVRYQDILKFVDIRGYGNFGEWTNNDFSHITPTVASLDSIIAYQAEAFNTFQMVVMIGSFDGGQLPNVNVPPAVGYFALMGSNAHGKFGWRRDNWGQQDSYIRNYLDLNPTNFGGIHFADSIMARYKYAPIVGEPQDCGSETNFSDLPTEGTRYGGNSFGNGNFNCGVNATEQNNFRLASKTFGYRLNLNPGGSTTTSPPAGGAFTIVQHWRNVGVSPTYQNWNCVYDLRTGPTAAPVWSGTSSFNPHLFFPAGSDNVVTDNFTLTSVPAGTYELHMTMKDPLGYYFPMPIYITNTQQADGSYIIQTGIVVTASGAVANAGPNQNISTSSVTLTSAASTGATSQVWSQISGPNSGSITTPTAVSTTVTGLITGTYVFQVCINGGPCSGQLISQVTIVVNAPVTHANAGSNQTITLPTSSALLDGSASTGASTYSWTNVSGPNTPTIATPTTTTTSVTGLIQGTYVFQLSINSGASTSTTSVTVLPAPLPIANAGVSQTITLPTSSVTVNGSGSSGTITSYSWTETSGPNNAVFGTATSVSTTISGLIQGTYLIQLALNGGVAVDTMRIYVNPAAPPIPTGQTIFTTQIPAGPTENDGPQGGLTGIELGVKFRSSVAGFVLGIRYYKTTQNNPGTHIGELYNSSGTRLAAATFVNEGTTGWQSVVFTTPIAILANTTYVAAYFSPNGNYVSTINGLNTAIVNGNLTALASGTDGVNGVYNYANTPTFPTLSFQKSDYWVDIIFASPNTNSCNCHSFPKFEKTKVINGF
jgi:hypothetical protein